MTMHVNFEMFANGLGGQYENNFSSEAKRALFDYLDSGEEIEYDPIAICCEYTEYASCSEAVREYDEVVSLSGELESEKWLEDNTWFAKFEGGVVVANF